jgi:hypothetical protein
VGCPPADVLPRCYLASFPFKLPFSGNMPSTLVSDVSRTAGLTNSALPAPGPPRRQLHPPLSDSSHPPRLTPGIRDVRCETRYETVHVREQRQEVGRFGRSHFSTDETPRRQPTVTPQQTCRHFTVYGILQYRAVLYDMRTMHGCCGAKTRRREHAAAVVCALSLFVALVAGSALRPHYTTNALPEPGAWTHAVEHVQHGVNEVQPVNATGTVIALKARGSSRPVPISRKPFRYVWMTHDLPSNWAPLSPHSDWSVFPKSFVSAQFQPRGAACAAFAGDSDDRHTSTLFCILRC